MSDDMPSDFHEEDTAEEVIDPAEINLSELEVDDDDDD